MQRPLATVALLACLVASAFAADKAIQKFEGKVVGIADGDTITVLDDEKAQHKVRLLAIDAPESKQPYSQLSKQALAKKVFGKRVQVHWRDKDAYGRLLGLVKVAGHNVNLEMVSEGWAWHFVRYSKAKAFAAAEVKAREEQVGLWAGDEPIAPWDWRKQEAERRAALAKLPPSPPPVPPEDVKVETTIIRRPMGLGAFGGRGGDSPAASDTVYVTRTGEKYHRAGCSALRKSQIAKSLADAKAAYEPCQLCNPPQ
jgi:endonuclease YncB( thermonuclease family)